MRNRISPLLLQFLAVIGAAAAVSLAVPAIPPAPPVVPPAKPVKPARPARPAVKPEKPEKPEKPPEKPQKSDKAATLVIDLGGKADQVRTGAAGRMLIFHIQGADNLTVVDVLAGKVVKQIPAPGDFHYAADKDKLLLVLNNQRVIQRWDLGTLEREKTVLLTDDRPVRLVSMGSAGNGPLALWPVGKVQFWDVATLKPLTVHGEVLDQSQGQLWPSADGLTFAAWGWSTVPYAIMQLSDLTPTSVDCRITSTPDGEDYNESWAMPGADGSQLIRHGARPYDLTTPTVTPIEPGPLKGSTMLPTEDPRFLLALRRTDPYKAQGNTCAIVAAADMRVLYTITDVEPVTGGQIGSDHCRLGPDPRVHYLPVDGLLVTIPDDNDKVVIRPFDLKEALDGTGADYLFVISKPPTRVKAGDPYRYQIETLSHAGGVKYKLEDGPMGMAVSDAGLVTWDKAGPPEGGKVGVIVDVSDTSGREVQHTVALNVARDVRKVGPAVAASATGVIELLPASAALHGGVKVEKEGNLGSWGPDDFLEWEFTVPAPGWYEVQLHQASQAGGAEYEITAGNQKVQGTVEQTGHPQRYTTVTVGKLLLPPGKTKLSIKPLKPSDKPSDKPAENSGDKNPDQARDKPAQKPSDKSADQASTKAPENLMNLKWVRLTPSSPPQVAGAAAPPPLGGRVGVSQRLLGVWVATPTVDEAKARALLAKKGVTDAEMDDAVAEIKKKMEGLKIIYAFNKDGTAVGSYGTDAEPHGAKATWKVTLDLGRMARILITPESGKSDQMEVTFFGPDRFTMTLPDGEVPVRTPVTFTRSPGPAPKVDEKPQSRPAK